MARHRRWSVPVTAYLALSACRIGFDELPDASSIAEDSGSDAPPIARTLGLGSEEWRPRSSEIENRPQLDLDVF